MGILDDRANLAGKVAVVVGGATGLGGAVSVDLAAAGVDVAVADIDAESLTQTSEAIGAQGRLVLSQALDARDPAALAQFFAALDRVADHVDILVNVAGGTQYCMFADSTPESWDADARWNFVYVMHTCRHAIPRMRRAGGGSIVSITTIEAHRAAPGYSVYAGYKAALTNFSRSLAVELGQDGIRVNTIALESIPTPGTARILSSRSDFARENPKRANELIEAGVEMCVPLQRMGTPQDVSTAVLFLASDLSSFTTGTTVHLDGGTWASSGWLRWPDDWRFFPRPTQWTLERLFSAEDQPS
jgi:NAD(P)-dependent dehydrogenase (short-subunit alcohol dehydrogenase family)